MNGIPFLSHESTARKKNGNLYFKMSFGFWRRKCMILFQSDA